uniref:Rho GTPase activating protein 6 n=1 Tax=Cynoglossus semilaevis TaxID=244447 RepID=A0A3P8VQK9_CYNSE
ILSGRSVRLMPVSIQSLSELERARLQEVAYTRLHQDYDLGCQITIPKDGQKRKKSLRRKLDSLAKEKSKDKEFIPQAFSIPLSQVIANDRTHRQRQDGYRQEHPQREEQKDSSDLVSSIIQVSVVSATSSLSSKGDHKSLQLLLCCSLPPSARLIRSYPGGMSVDSITDLDDNHSRLLEALQLSLPAETPSKKEKHRDKRLSLNPIYRQVPRVVDSCCQHIEKYGLQTVGIFRVGSSKKRVRQLREEFDRGIDVQLDEEHSVHDVAALLKEFLRDMPDPLLTKELYTAFINSTRKQEQQNIVQLLVYLLPACNSDTLHRLLDFLSTVAAHANDQQDKDGQEITGNKMTSLNLATIFGPNLLHKQKSSDKEFSVQSSARAEESTAVIAVLQRMIASNQALFMVSPDLQNEVLMSLLETDPDVVDYLLRRKLIIYEGLDGLDGRHQAPVHRTMTAPDCRCHPPVTRVCSGPNSESGRTHSQLKICPSATSQINSTQSPQQLGRHRLQGVATAGPHRGPAAVFDGRSPPPYNTHHLVAGSQSSPQLSRAQLPPLVQGRSNSRAQSKSSNSTTDAQLMPHSPEWQDWQRDRWQIWQLLSSDNTDALPETLV